MLNLLPNELLMNIAIYLNDNSLFKLFQVNKKCHSLNEDVYFWRYRASFINGTLSSKFVKSMASCYFWTSLSYSQQLTRAAKDGDFELIKSLVKAGCLNFDFITASEYNNMEIAEYLWNESMETSCLPFFNNKYILNSFILGKPELKFLLKDRRFVEYSLKKAISFSGERDEMKVIQELTKHFVYNKNINFEKIAVKAGNMRVLAHLVNHYNLSYTKILKYSIEYNQINILCVYYVLSSSITINKLYSFIELCGYTGNRKILIFLVKQAIMLLKTHNRNDYKLKKHILKSGKISLLKGHLNYAEEILKNTEYKKYVSCIRGKPFHIEENFDIDYLSKCMILLNKRKELNTLLFRGPNYQNILIYCIEINNIDRFTQILYFILVNNVHEFYNIEENSNSEIRIDGNDDVVSTVLKGAIKMACSFKIGCKINRNYVIQQLSLKCIKEKKYKFIVPLVRYFPKNIIKSGVFDNTFADNRQKFILHFFEKFGENSNKNFLIIAKFFISNSINISMDNIPLNSHFFNNLKIKSNADKIDKTMSLIALNEFDAAIKILSIPIKYDSKDQPVSQLFQLLRTLNSDKNIIIYLHNHWHFSTEFAQKYQDLIQRKFENSSRTFKFIFPKKNVYSLY